MANTFKNSINEAIGTSGSIIYSAPPGSQVTAIGLNLANVSNSNIYATVKLHSNGTGNTSHIVKNTLIPVGGSIALIGGDQKIVLESSDFLSASSSLDLSLDTVTSVLEIT